MMLVNTTSPAGLVSHTYERAGKPEWGRSPPTSKRSTHPTWPDRLRRRTIEGPRAPTRPDPMADNADNTLTAESRTVVGSRPAGRLPPGGKVPAVMDGLQTDTTNLTLPGL